MPRLHKAVGVCEQRISRSPVHQRCWNTCRPELCIYYPGRRPDTDDRTLTPVESQEIVEISGQYLSLFDQSCRYHRTDYLEILGSGLFHLFFEIAWVRISSIASCGNVKLVVASDIPEVLLLPWEIVRPPRRRNARVRPIFSIVRLPEQQNSLPQFIGQLSPGPFRVVFAACAPRQPLDCVKEVESFLEL
jgi:hypothetical protein